MDSRFKRRNLLEMLKYLALIQLIIGYLNALGLDVIKEANYNEIRLKITLDHLDNATMLLIAYSTDGWNSNMTLGN